MLLFRRIHNACVCVSVSIHTMRVSEVRLSSPVVDRNHQKQQQSNSLYLYLFYYTYFYEIVHSIFFSLLIRFIVVLCICFWFVVGSLVRSFLHCAVCISCSLFRDACVRCGMLWPQRRAHRRGRERERESDSEKIHSCDDLHFLLLSHYVLFFLVFIFVGYYYIFFFGSHCCGSAWLWCVCVHICLCMHKGEESGIFVSALRNSL